MLEARATRFAGEAGRVEAAHGVSAHVEPAQPNRAVSGSVTGGNGAQGASHERPVRRRPDGDEVCLSLPADVGYVAAIRLTAAGLAARCELTVDEIEDLRLAVDEACGLVLAHAHSDVVLSVSFELSVGVVVVEVSVPGSGEIDMRGLSWIVLGELATSVADVSGAGRVGLALSKRRAR